MTRKYTETHEWIDLETGKFGISSFAIAQLGDIVFIDLPEVGKILKAKDEIAVVESVKAASEIYAPVGGEIVEVNEELRSNPASMTAGTWEKSWIGVIKITDKSEADSLKTTEEYEKTIG